MMKNWKIILLVIAILLGGVLEVFKAVIKSGQSQANITRQELSDLDLRPFVSFKQQKKRNKRLGIQTNSFRTTVFKRKLKKAKVSIAKKYKQDKEPIYAHEFDESGKKKKGTEKKTTKKVAKNKKKDDKEKKVNAKDSETEKFFPTDESRDQLVDNLNPDTTLTNNVAPVEFLPKNTLPVPPGDGETAEDEDGIPQTVEGWVALVVQSPSFENTTLLIQAYTSGSLKDSSVFFAVVEAMINSDNKKVYKNGLRALSVSINKTPNNQSFSLLSNIIENNPIGTKKRTDAEIILKQNYTSIQHLNTLRSILSNSSSEFEVSKAIQMIQLSAQKNLSVISEEDKTLNLEEQENESATSAQYVLQIKSYQEVLKDLEDFIGETSENQQLYTEANEAVQSIKKLISEITKESVPA